MFIKTDMHSRHVLLLCLACRRKMFSTLLLSFLIFLGFKSCLFRVLQWTVLDVCLHWKGRRDSVSENYITCWFQCFQGFFPLLCCFCVCVAIAQWRCGGVIAVGDNGCLGTMYWSMINNWNWMRKMNVSFGYPVSKWATIGRYIQITLSSTCKRTIF